MSICRIFLKRIYGLLKIKFKNVSYFWIIDNSIEVFKKIGSINFAHWFYTFDFESIFSNIPADLLYNTLKELFDAFHIEEEFGIKRKFFSKFV